MGTTQGQRAGVYVRISNDPAGERAGVERQRTECLRLAEANGWTVTRIYEDNDVSAYSGRTRPAYEELLADAAAGLLDVVVVWATDRLYRRVSDLVDITAKVPAGVGIRTVMGGEVDLTTAEGRMRAQIMGSVGEFESARKGERVKAAAHSRANNGRTTQGARPLGWAWVDACPGGSACDHAVTCEPGTDARPRVGARRGLAPHPVEAPLLAEAYRRVAEGGTLAAAARWLMQEGVRGSTGKPFDGVRLADILREPRHGGLASYKGAVTVELESGHRIVDRDLWDRVQVILSDPSRKTGPGRPTVTPLAKVLRCGKCGGTMCASTNSTRSGTRLPVYRCSLGRHLDRRRDLLDDPILDLVGEVLAGLGSVGLLAPSKGVDTSGPVRDQIRVLEDSRDQLASLVASGTLDPADFAMAVGKIRAELEMLSAQLTRQVGRPALAGLGGDVRAAWAALRKRAAEGDVDGLRAVLAELVDHIEVEVPATKGRPAITDVEIVWADWIPGTPPARPEVAS